MGKSKRKRPSTTKDEPKPKKVRSDNDDEESDSGSDKTGDNKHRSSKLTASPKGDTNNKNGAIQSGETDESESDDEYLVKIAKRSENDKKLEVEAIISNKQFKGKTKYLLKWKDGSETWETKKKTTKVCPDFLREYTEEAKKALEVEAIVSQRKKNYLIKYLIKWKDHSKGETWETEFRAKQLCPELVTLYVQEMEMAKKKAMEVEAIVEHKLVHRKHKYLLKWKDHSKGETWETARKTISVCPDILDEFMKDRPEAVPPSDYFNPFCWWYKETKDKPKRRRNFFAPTKLSDDEEDEESDENTEWEVARIVKHKNKTGKRREFLIRWKGYTAEDDTWEAEENLNCPDLIKKYLAKVANGKRKDRRPMKKQADRHSNELTAQTKKTDSRSSKRLNRKPRPVYFDAADD